MPDITDFFIAKFRELINREPKAAAYFIPRTYRNAAVRFRECSINDFEERRRILFEQAGLNVFLFPASKIPGCDLLSDSGTTTMTMEQWAQLMLGDEAYGSNEGYFMLKEQVVATFGESWQQKNPNVENLFIFHQGRAAEFALFSTIARELSKKEIHRKELSTELPQDLRETIKAKLSQHPKIYYIIPNNAHFDTTEANIHNSNILPLNLPCAEHLANKTDYKFRGNINLLQLRALLANERERIPIVYLTITNNTGGGQPVSLENIKAVRKLTREFKVPFFFDACRFAENAWFIKHHEQGYADKSVQAIIHEMFENVDGFHISLKKDGLVNIGGAIVIKETGLFAEIFAGIQNKLTDHQILTEGHPTYGGLAGRDLKALVQGLKTVVQENYLDARIKQTQRFGKRLTELHIPIIEPVGGHAVYLDVDRFFEGTSNKDADFKGLSLTALLLIAGHRLCELGIYAFGSFENGREYPPVPRVNCVRAAIPRLAYEDQDLMSLAEAIRILFEHKEKIPAIDIIYGRDLTLRHFKSRYRFRNV